MADTVKIHLEGGPCNGRNATARVADFGPAEFTCEGVDYEPTDRKTHSGLLIYVTKASQAPPPVNKPGHHATSSWHRLMKASLHDLPHAVQRSNEHLRHIRRLTRHH